MLKERKYHSPQEKTDILREHLINKVPVSEEDARRETDKYVNKYNNERLHAAIGYIAPVDKLEGCAQTIFDERKRKLAEAQERRKAEYAARKGDRQNNSMNQHR